MVILYKNDPWSTSGVCPWTFFCSLYMSPLRYAICRYSVNFHFGADDMQLHISLNPNDIHQLNIFYPWSNTGWHRTSFNKYDWCNLYVNLYLVVLMERKHIRQHIMGVCPWILANILSLVTKLLGLNRHVISIVSSFFMELRRLTNISSISKTPYTHVWVKKLQQTKLQLVYNLFLKTPLSAEDEGWPGFSDRTPTLWDNFPKEIKLTHSRSS